MHDIVAVGNFYPTSIVVLSRVVYNNNMKKIAKIKC